MRSTKLGPEMGLSQLWLAHGAHLVRIRNFGTSPEISAQIMNGLKGLAAEMGAGLEITAFSYPRCVAWPDVETSRKMP